MDCLTLEEAWVLSCLPFHCSCSVEHTRGNEVSDIFAVFVYFFEFGLVREPYQSLMIEFQVSE